MFREHFNQYIFSSTGLLQKDCDVIESYNMYLFETKTDKKSRQTNEVAITRIKIQRYTSLYTILDFILFIYLLNFFKHRIITEKKLNN